MTPLLIEYSKGPVPAVTDTVIVPRFPFAQVAGVLDELAVIPAPRVTRIVSVAKTYDSWRSILAYLALII